MAAKKRLGRGLSSIIAGGSGQAPAKAPPAKKTARKSAPAKKTATKKTSAAAGASKPAGPAAKPAREAGRPTEASASVPVEDAGSSNGEGGLRELYRDIPVARVQPNPYQPRREISEERVRELAESIRSEGLLQPIVVRRVGEGYQLIAGERRWRAHQSLGLKSIPARVLEATDASSAVISLIENLQREALNPIEESLGYASLMRDFDLTQEAVAERLGRARASIANALRLLALDRQTQGFVARGLLSTGHAKVLLGLEDEARRQLLAKRIVEEGLSVRETEKAVRKLKEEGGSPGRSPTRASAENENVVIRDLEKRIAAKLNTRVSLKHSPKKGRMVIEYFGNDDLQRILDQIGVQS